MLKPAPTIEFIVPCYNEEAVLPATARQLEALLSHLVEQGDIAADSRVCLIDDGSSDRTWSIIAGMVADSARFTGLKLSRNFGHQNALMAGLSTSRADAVITIDADLQDDPGVIAEMLTLYRQGRDVVYGVRRNRDSDSFFKRGTARLFYAMMHFLGVKLVSDHADFRLTSRQALDWLLQYDEVNLFLRGIVSNLTDNCACVSYTRTPRKAGTTHYPLRRMLSFAWNGITSCSIVPLRLTLMMGLLSALFAAVLAFWTLKIKLFGGAVPGWASTLLPLTAFSAVQLLALAIIAEYLAKTFMETKRRPRFLIEQEIDSPQRREVRKES